jgi:phosphoglycerol geranylgeranyltransferase
LTGTVYGGIVEALQRRPLHFTLLDPDKQPPMQAARMAEAAEAAGSDAIMIGGSTGYTREQLDRTTVAIKGACDLPTILFPTNSGLLTPKIDAIFFMSLLNSRSPDFLIREHARAAPFIKRSKVEAIPMGYLIVAPGMRVGEVGQAECVPRDRPDIAVGYALAAELLGMKLVYLEAGSGAPDPVPARMVRAVAAELSVPLIVGGGITTSRRAAAAVRAGADIVVTGTMVEAASDVERALRDVIRAMRGGG